MSTDTDHAEITVRDRPEQHRFVAEVDGQVAGFAAYLLGEGLITFTHTEVDPAYEGRGVGSALARAALDAVREDGGLQVVPRCPFIAGWIGHHPEYADLVAAGQP